MNVKEIVSHIPDYSCFMTVDELDASTFRLAEQYPDRVQVRCVGHSRQGHPIQLIQIGHGRKNALVFACPHPNEPIGALTVDFLTWELAANEALERELDYTWYFIKCIDIDGIKMNEGWFKGPFGITNYMHHYFRPAFRDQVEWTFPVEYKRLKFNSPIPETKVLMELIDTLHPEFMFSLHNLGFGGAYWYLSSDVPELYPKFFEVVEKMGIPRKLGEAEVPYATAFAPAVFKLLTVKDEYDYNSRYISKEYAVAHHTYGTFSGDYANRSGGKTFTFVNELPYFYDARVADLSDSDMTRREAVRQSCDYKVRHYEDINAQWQRVKALISKPDNHFATALEERMRSGVGGIQAQKRWAEENEAFEKKATVAQVFDNLYVARFFQATVTTLLLRACEKEAARTENAADKALLTEVWQWAEDYLRDECGWLEENMNYPAIPVQKLVTVQASCGLLTAQYISQT